ncbi:16S rRNA (cytosine(967)-C(5))-methyltransferase RsmB [Anaerotignum sp.]
MIQINPREIAAEALMEIMEAEAYNTMTLRRLLRQNGAMPRQDRAFVTEIVNGTLRNLIYIDHVLNTFSKTKTEKMKPWLLAVLRSAVYQIYFMDVPDAAACNEAVKLAGARGYASLKGFVNGVLRTVAKKKTEIPLPEKGTAEYLSVAYSHPLWLVRMWIAYYGYEETEAICAYDNQPPDVTIRVNTLKTNQAELKQMLEDAGVEVKDGRISEYALHLTKTADLSRLEAFQKGFFHVQDESSQLAVRILDPQKGESILDMCAAPGGKSFTTAETMENEGRLLSCDIYEHKIELMEEGAERLGIGIMECSVKDGAEAEEEQEGFDRVLVDAPCSGLGLMRKKPDIRLKKDGNEIDSLTGIQRRILENAAGYVKEGGVLVYSTCTLCRKENEKNLEWFLQNHPEFTAEDITKFLPADWNAETAEKGYLTLLPHKTGTDGFFISRMRRKD